MAGVRLAGLALLVVVAVAGAGCSSAADDQPEQGGPAAACAHFRAVVTETAAGNMTERQVRDEFVQIASEAEAASAAGLADAAGRVVSSLNLGDMVAFEQAFRDADAACAAAGL